MISSLPSILNATAAIRRGELTPTAIVEYCLERIRQMEPQAHAWVLVDDAGALREARRQTELAARGEFLGPLHGIPLGIKDIIDVAGWPTRCGSPLRGAFAAEQDAEIVRQLRGAGAILLGKTVTTEFASFDPPPTRNPWNWDRTPGGSSSGSAAAVALQMCVAAIGSQTGGSIVRPASYCGVVGLKPSYGVVPLGGIEPLAWHMDHPGPLARSVEDATQVFAVLAGETPGDLRPAPLTSGEPPLLIALRGQFIDQRGDAATGDAFRTAIERLQAGGLSVQWADDEVFPFDEWLASHKAVMAVEAAMHHRTEFAANPEQFGPKIRSLIEEGINTSSVRYAAALHHQQRLQAELPERFAQSEIYLMPSTTTPAPGVESTGDPAFNSPWSFAGLPTVTIPCGVSPDGLPCGLQFIGGNRRDRSLLEVAARCEAILAFPGRP